MKEIVSIRVDALWKMLSQKKDGLFPEPYEEGATGKLDNKGAIFIPGGLIYKDVDEMPICYDSNSVVTPEFFRKKVREAMQYDNATLLFPDGIATGINLDSGFFSKAARHIYTFREAAFRRKKRIKDHIYFTVISDDIIRSHCPTYIPRPYGARTRISSCAVSRLKMLFVGCGFIDNHTTRTEVIMEMKKVLAGWSKICPGCNIGRKYPDSFIGKKVRNHWEKGCISHNAYVEVYGSDELSPKKSEETSDGN